MELHIDGHAVMISIYDAKDETRAIIINDNDDYDDDDGDSRWKLTAKPASAPRRLPLSSPTPALPSAVI